MTARDRHWFVVRGISDYGENATKNDDWHAYAALVAASYIKGVLEFCPPFDKEPIEKSRLYERDDRFVQKERMKQSGSARRIEQVGADTMGDTKGGRALGSICDIQAVVDALIAIPQLADDYERRTILAALPTDLRAAVPDSVRGRIHMVGLVQTCERTPGGRSALLSALQLSLGADSPDFHRIEEVFATCWTER